jgi:2-polyprenyl-6-methoxyphenol hydroxylase-like FAD-dependent oxidoreductase
LFATCQLDIYEDDGQAALAAAGLTEEFRAIIHEGAEAVRMLDQHGTVLPDDPDDDGTAGRPEVLRGDLRQILLDSLPKEMIQWGRKVAEVRSLGEGRHEVTFADGATATTGLLVGADGAWSRVRPLLSDAKPEYFGTTFIETYLYDADEWHSATAEAVGDGAMYALTPGKAIAAHPDDVEAALAAYEEALFPRSEPFYADHRRARCDRVVSAWRSGRQGGEGVATTE